MADVPQLPSERVISIHAPPRGATRRAIGRISKHSHFNSRPSARGDEIVRAEEEKPEISIHAPPRGATCFLPRGIRCAKYFNSRPSARGDMATAAHAGRPTAFQFTPLREGRQFCLRCGSRMGYFNSRPSARGDPPTATPSHSGAISIHAPPRGATRRRPTTTREDEFQFTPLREGRPLTGSVCRRVISYFNSRPSARGDHNIC